MVVTSSSSSSPDIGAPPPIIPPIEQTVGGRKFAFWTTVEEHFADVANDNTDFHPNVAEFLPLLTPRLTKAGKVAKRQPEIPKKSLKWWRAQCGFRGLKMTGTIQDLQGRLREFGGEKESAMSAKMAELRDQMKREWSEKNSQKVEEEWKSSDDSRKAQLWPKRFLFEKCLETPERRKVATVVRVTDWANAMEKAAPEMGVEIETMRIPVSMYPDGVYKSGLRDVVLGVDKKAVRAKAAEISRGRDQIRQKEAQEKAEKKHKKQEDFEKEYSRAEQHAGKRSGYWDVGGRWKISCPYIEEQWGRNDDECTLDIHVADNGKESVQMYAMFEFIALTGIMRFVNPEAEHHSDDEKDDDDEPDDEEDDYSNAGGETPDLFLLSETQLPSSKNREFSYRWRGEETGEGEIQLYSDKRLCSLEFTSPNSLHGTIDGGFLGKVEFRGFKEKSLVTDQVGQKRKRRGDAYIANEEWQSRNEAAYERARVGRWH
ncbi:hypothetical protein VTN00DRAFT_38 [Thermoascus crustaceus]|uniref:uncharacterized protein n=1 Tax=Thermoascus crustaceus TaxID=5088 RepID=UPI0037425948